MTRLHNKRSALLMILGSAAVGICHGFSSAQTPLSSSFVVQERGLIATYARKIPEFTVDDDDEDYSAGKSNRRTDKPPSFSIDDDGGEYVNFIDDDDGGKYEDFIDGQE